MIVKRFSKFNQNLTFWHATKKENVRSILKSGLKISDRKTGEERESRDGLPRGMATGILYLSRDLENLVIDPRKLKYKDKYALLEINVPKEVFESWNKDIDPIHKFYKTKKDYIIGVIKAKYKRHPEKFTEFERVIRQETKDFSGDFWKEVYPKSNEYNVLLEEIKDFNKNSVLVIKNNIPAKYIKLIK